MRLSRQHLVGLIAAGGIAVAATGHAFTASNSVPNATLGQGTGSISGYSVSDVAYNADGTTPTNLDSVTFTISPASASSVSAQVVSGGTWYTCTNVSGSVTCPTTSPQATVSSANSLDVIANQ